MAISQEWEEVKEDSLDAVSTVEVDTAKKKSEIRLCGDKEKIFQQPIVVKGSKQQPQK